MHGMIKFGIDINGTSLQKVDKVNFSGVLVDSKLTWCKKNPLRVLPYTSL